MDVIIRASDVKPDFDNLKEYWSGLLGKYFEKGSLKIEHSIKTDCPHCKSAKVSSSFNLNGFIHNKCENCCTLYVSPRLSDEAITEIYSDDYYSAMYARTMLPVFEKRKKIIGQGKYNQLIEISHFQKGKVLDIGAGIGEVTEVFLDNGWETHAIEMNKGAIDWLNSRGHSSVFHGSLDNYVAEGEFDIIMAWGVVEHVLDPDAFLNKVCSLLKPGGVFVSEVPHGNSLLVDVCGAIHLDPKRILMGEQHIVLYSMSAYKELHQRNGFNLLHIQTNGLDVSTICKESGFKFSDEIIQEFQKYIDAKCCGDLLRGYWVKRFN